MSWEPLDPIGFSPCGIAFGAARRDYSAPGRFFADDALANNRIRWFRVPDNTPVYEKPTVFTPRIDDIAEMPPVEYEKTGPARNIRRYVDPPLTHFYPGDHVHGDAADFLGLSPRSKYEVADPFNPGETIQRPNYCQKPILSARVRLGVGMLPYTPAGVRLRANLIPVTRTPPLLLGGLSLDSFLIPVDPFAGPLAARIGLDVAKDAPLDTLPWLNAHLGVGAVPELIGNPPPILLTGLGVKILMFAPLDTLPWLNAHLGAGIVPEYFGNPPPVLLTGLGVDADSSTEAFAPPEMLSGLGVDAFLDSPLDALPWLNALLRLGIVWEEVSDIPAEMNCGLGIFVAMDAPLDTLPWLSARLGVDGALVVDPRTVPTLDCGLGVDGALVVDPETVPTLDCGLGADGALVVDPRTVPTLDSALGADGALVVDPRTVPTLDSALGVDGTSMVPIWRFDVELGLDGALVVDPRTVPTLDCALGVDGALVVDPRTVPTLDCALGVDGLMRVVPILWAELGTDAILEIIRPAAPILECGLGVHVDMFPRYTADGCGCSTVSTTIVASGYLWTTAVCACSSLVTDTAFPISEVCACSSLVSETAFPISDVCACSSVYTTHTP